MEPIDLDDAFGQLRPGTVLYTPSRQPDEYWPAAAFVEISTDVLPGVPGLVTREGLLVLFSVWLSSLPRGLEVGFDPDIQVELPSSTEDLVRHMGVVPTISLLDDFGLTARWHRPWPPQWRDDEAFGFAWPPPVPPKSLPFSFVAANLCMQSPGCFSRSHSEHRGRCRHGGCVCPP